VAVARRVVGIKSGEKERGMKKERERKKGKKGQGSCLPTEVLKYRRH